MELENTVWHNITLVLTAITALAASISAIGAWLSARATKFATEAQLFSKFMEEYGAHEMVISLRTLRNWKAEKGKDFEEKWLKSFVEGNSDAQDVDRARRHVKFYFLKALRLYESGFASKKFVKEVISVDGIHILFNIIEPIEHALDPDYNKIHFDKLKKLYESELLGKLIRPVPVDKR